MTHLKGTGGRKLIRALCASLMWLVSGGCVAGSNGSHAVVFMYHHFGVAQYPSTNIRLEQFEQHLSYLAEHDFRVWPLKRIVSHLRHDKPIPDRTVALTMDDAYRSVYTQAYPRLKARGWPFTVFVSTDYVDQGLSNYLTWDQMREMQRHGASYGNHSASHAYLTRRRQDESERAWRERVRNDIQRAQARLREELDAVTRLFAYPFGEYSRPLAGLVTELGYVGMGQHSGAVGPRGDLRALPRFALNEQYGDPEAFRVRANSLPMPVVSADPWDPVLDGANPPALRITLAHSDARLDALACYASGQGRVTVEWLQQAPPRFEVRAPEPLPEGRSRYNCTVPAADNGTRFYWYSHLWVRQGQNRSASAQEPTSH